ncbi:phytoene desaturase family protein [Cohnella pontilimi]|uniref:phytoene desaturase family protein n=1 Tax=Cohnella pontilimi TaxID=2564100 RepID=UPI001FE95BCF|nr:NAD(P)/FAD-dependent oxidoreductase [Cohnella pontilimi]
MDFDAIIIGSGHNGLACALILAKAGWKVAVLEKADIPGGASKSAEITQKGFIHDLYATNIGSFLGGPFYREFGQDMHRHGFSTVFADKPFANVFPDGTGVGVYKDEEKTNTAFKNISESDYHAWQQLKQDFDATVPQMVPLMEMELPSWQAGKQLIKMYRTLKFKRTMELGSLILQSPREFVESRFESEKIRALFVPWAFHLDFGPDVSNGAVFPYIEVISNHRNGMGFTKGGISHLIGSLIAAIKEHNGQILLGKSVDQILIKNNKAVGVRLSDGQELYAKRVVIGNITPTQLITRLLKKEQLPSQYVQKAENYRYGPGTMMIHLALDDKLQWKAGEEFSSFAYVHIGPYINDIAKTYVEATNGLLPESPMLVVGQQSVIDTSRAPEGKQTLWVQVRALPAKSKGDAANQIQPATWDSMKGQYADRVIDKLAQYAPNVKGIILDRKVLSPMDLQNDNPNLVGGDSVGGSHHLFQYYIFRPIPGYSRYNTPIDRLYLCGAATWPGGGLNGTSGYLLAKKLLRK